MAVMSHRGVSAVSEGRAHGEESRASSSRASRERAADKKAPVETFPRIITLSREFGAGGARIAGRVAVELGFQLWDDELIAYVARKANAEPTVVRELDEHPRDLLRDVVAGSFWGTRISGSKYRSLVTHAVGELAKRGGAVIVGRGANFLVEPEQALRVRVVCPLKQRVDRHARKAQVAWAEAAQHVQHMDQERERFVRQLCAEQCADPAHYDLIVNTRDLSDETAARLITSAYRARFGAPTKQREEHASAP
jgi:hypothetical protein